MNRVFTVIVFAALVLAAVPAFAQETGHEQKPPSGEGAPAHHAVTNDVVVRVDGKPITEKEVMNFIDQTAGSQRMEPEQIVQRYGLFFKDALDDLIGLALLHGEAKNLGIKVSKEKVDESIEAAVKNFKTPEEFKEALNREGLTDAAFRLQIEDELMIQQVIAQATKEIPTVSDAEIKKFYGENSQYFEGPSGKRSLEEAKSDIQNFLQRKSKQESLRKHVEGLKAKAKIETVMTQEEWNKRHAKGMPEGSEAPPHHHE